MDCVWIMNVVFDEIKHFLQHLTLKRVIILHVLIGLVVFFNALFSPFVWDDIDYIINAPETHSLNPLVLFGNNIFNNSNQYRPFVISYFSILYHLFGTIQFFYHAIQLSIHITNSILVYRLFIFFMDVPLALFFSLIFLIHPMQVESVSYIASSGGAICFLLGTSSLLLRMQKNQTTKKTFLSYTLLLACLLTKESGLLFIIVFLLFTYIWRKRDFLKASIINLGIIFFYGFLRFTIGNVSIASRPMIPIARLGLPDRLLSLPKIIWYYLQTFFYPETLAINQQWVVRKVSLQGVLLPLFFDIFFLCIIILCGWFLFVKKRKLLFPYVFFTVWFFVAMVIHIQFIPLDMTVADRWFYTDMAGLLGCIAIVVKELPFSKTNST